MEGTYTQRGHTHEEDIHIEGTQRGLIYRENIYMERT